MVFRVDHQYFDSAIFSAENAASQTSQKKKQKCVHRHMYRTGELVPHAKPKFFEFLCCFAFCFMKLKSATQMTISLSHVF